MDKIFHKIINNTRAIQNLNAHSGDAYFAV